MESFLAGLNAAQHAAVTSPASVLQVLAPPGSGKTKTLSARVAHLLQHDGLTPWNVIICTFTVKAAREMKERIGNLIGDGLESKLILGTFHSVARRYLVRYGHLIGLRKDFGIADSSDSLGIIKRIIKRRKLNIDPGAARSRISHQKAQCVSHEQYSAGNKKNIEQQEFSIVYTAYEQSLAMSNLLDYDDLLLRCVDLLRNYGQCVSNVEAVLVDEFQDTNVVQYDLMRLFAQYQHRITIVGDPDQSIYGFRSAEMKNLQRMCKQYPDTLVARLEENYRSSGSILLLASELIEQDPSRPAKPILPTHCVGTTPVLRKLPTASIEASWIVSEIRRSIALTGHLLTYNDIAVLVRSASLTRPIETAFNKSGIPYRMVGGHRFFDRPEVRILIDYLRVINRPDNSDALARIINTPPRKVGDKTVERLLEAADAKQITLWSVVSGCLQGNNILSVNLSNATQQGLGGFQRLILAAKRKVSGFEATAFSLLDLLDFLMKELTFRDFLEKSFPEREEFEVRWSNVQELLAQAAELSGSTVLEYGEEDEEALPPIDGVRQEEASSADNALSNFLANVALSSNVKSEDEDSDPQGRVTITTIHAAKGLEWPVVFIPATYEGSIPHSRAEDTHEERRLLYVAMTRAKVMLYLSCPIKNSQNDQTRMSSFLTHKSVMSLLEKNGPSITYSVVQSIAHILRRPTPSTSDIASSSHGIHLEDNLWSLGGEEVVGEESQRHQTDWSETKCSVFPAFERPQVNTLNRNDFNNLISSKASFPDTTMRNLASYSVSIARNTSINITAKSHLPGFRAQKASCIADAHRGRARSKYNCERSDMGEPDQSTSTGTHTLGSYKAARVQGNLKDFFKKQDDSGSVAYFSSKAPRRQPLPVEQTLRSKKIKLENPKSELQEADLTAPEHRLEKHGQPLSPLLGQHRLLHGAQMGTRPRLAHSEDHVTKDYVFFSSSPPPIESSSHKTEHKSKTNPAPSLPSVHSNQENKAVDSSGHRPAATMHTTSIAYLKNNTLSSKKTLGVKRSMNGWASRTNPGFVLPSGIRTVANQAATPRR